MKPPYESLSPGIRGLVQLLNDAGFDTTDSGDGSNHAAGMGCAVPWPMVAILVDRNKVCPFKETDRLARLLEFYGVQLGTLKAPDRLVCVQLMYSPTDRNCIISVDNVLDSDLL